MSRAEDWDDLLGRLAIAAASLIEQQFDLKRSDPNFARLQAKVEGVKLAIDYMRGYPQEEQVEQGLQEAGPTLAERVERIEQMLIDQDARMKVSGEVPSGRSVGGWVLRQGGGSVTVLVDRDTKDYPPDRHRVLVIWEDDES